MSKGDTPNAPSTDLKSKLGKLNKLRQKLSESSDERREVYLEHAIAMKRNGNGKVKVKS